ncbi:hypothetical protein P5663_06930 [Priestia flexa]|uniref:hypothetical protein n=1 Tax=Priestia flexa TaxID=86664 RepID=UPI00240E35BE|nr:hypothetical protein [Priestia flexa]WEZ09571.1 hypothetical protein P5663_06930 [Priestia flexa]
MKMVYNKCIMDGCEWEEIRHKTEDGLRCPECKGLTDQRVLTEENILNLIKTSRKFIEKRLDEQK